MNTANTRITGGEFRGRGIKSPNLEKTHPMGSRERLAILNSIGPEIVGATVLDLYAGTGALGLEALSRGAKFDAFVEKNPKTLAILKENLEKLGIENFSVFAMKVEDFSDENSSEIVFIDPPYDKYEIFLDNFSKIYENSLKNAKKIIISHPKNLNIDLKELKLFRRTDKSFAGAGISIFTK